MHSFTGSKGTTFHYNSDYSGNITIMEDNAILAEIPACDFMEFARSAFASEVIELIEDRYC